MKDDPFFFGVPACANERDNFWVSVLWTQLRCLLKLTVICLGKLPSIHNLR